MKRAAVWMCAVAAAACATESFQPRFQAPSAPTQPVVLSELLKPHARTERPVLVGLTPDPMRLFAWDPQQNALLWEQEVHAKSLPLVAADAVVLQEQDGVVVRDLNHGRERVRIDDGGVLVGADGERDALVLTLAYDDKLYPGAVIVIDGDSVRWKQRLNLPVGVAAISGDYVSVPWATQRLSILRASDGLELSRQVFKSDVLGHVLVDRGAIYVGQLGLLPLTRELFEQPDHKHTPYTPAKRTLPAQPDWLRDGYKPVPDPDNAQHRLQLTWRIALDDNGAPRSEDDELLLRFYRVLFGLEASSDHARWVRSFDHDLVAAAVQPGSITIVDSEGTVRVLDPQGNTRLRNAIGRQVRAATLRLGTWLPPVKPQFAGEPPLEPVQGTLDQQLMAAATLADDRVGAARAYAATLLARSDDPDVTAQLIELCGEHDSPEQLRATACSELAARTRGDHAVLSALRVRASFLEGTEAPPVGPLAQAAAKMRLEQAGPLLVSHIEDPNTSLRDLVAVFAAVQTLQERSAAASVERFVRLHHAEPEGSELVPALNAALQTMATLRLPSQRATLQDVAGDALTPKVTRDAAEAALNALDAPPPSDAPPAPEKPVRASDDVQTDPRAYALAPDVVRKALAPVRDKLTHCLAADASHPHAGRANLVVDGDGSVEGVFVLPATLQACAEPLLRATKFPSTRLGRQHITHTFAASPEKPAKPSKH